MKALGILILAVAAGLAAYYYAYDPLVVDLLGIQKVKEAPIEPPKPVVVVTEAPEPKPEPKPEPMKPEPKPEPMPQLPVMTTAGLGEMKEKPVDPDAFQPPTLPTVEEATKNWMIIPPAAFKSNPPHTVKLMKPVEFVATINGNKFGSKIPAGGNVVAVGQEGDNITVAPSPGSPARAVVKIDETDLKSVLTQVYERWKVARIAAVRRAWERNKLAASMPQPTTTASGAPVSNDKPEKAADGTYALLLDSMKSGQVTEVTPAIITKWGDPEQETIDGKNYWTIAVNYTTKTMFGDFPTAAKAFIINGRVEKWLYKESGEVVP
jgi:hypothetical protein